MKRFIKYVIIFSSFIALTLSLGEIVVRHISNTYSTKDKYLREDADEIRTLILGNSQTFFGIIPDSLQSEAFNLANTSQNYEYDWRLLKHYYSLMPELKTVIIPVSYLSFFDPPFEKSDDKWNEIYYKIYNGIDKYPDFSRYNLELSNIYVYQGKLKGAITGNRHGLCSPKGFGLDFNIDSRVQGWKNTAKFHAAKHTAPDDRYNAYNIAFLDSLLNFCVSHDITPLMITTPTWKGYREALDPKQLKRTYYITDSIVRSRSIYYHDYSADSRFTDEDFYDADHLNDKGAVKFTRILRRHL